MIKKKIYIKNVIEFFLKNHIKQLSQEYRPQDYIRRSKNKNYIKT